MFAFGHAACIAKAIALYRGSTLATGDMVQDHLRSTLTLGVEIEGTTLRLTKKPRR